MKLIPTILCGGAGSRLWPVSRALHPKPFIRFDDGQSLLQKAWLRGGALQNVDEIITVTNRELFFKTEDEYLEIAHIHQKSIANTIILEPVGRNTAAAIAAAALHVSQTHGDEAVMLILAADHLITDQDAFANAVALATKLVRLGKLVSFGIQPESAETGYGYIEADRSSPIVIEGELGKKDGCFPVLSFVEKPDLETAEGYLESGRYLWNSGIYCFTAGKIIDEMKQYCPQIIDSTQMCLARSRHAKSSGFIQIELDFETFSKVPDNSIDYAVMEKSTEMTVISCRIGWSDIGSWLMVGDLIEPDIKGNRIEGEVLVHNTSNCFIQGKERIIGVVGVSGLIIVDTPDALLVVDRAHAQDVKYLYAKLKEKNHEAHKIHRTAHRPWGTYTVLEIGEGFKIKRIEVKPGASLSLQMHRHRSEHWIVVSGTAKVVNGEEEFIVNTNESTYIPAGHCHRLSNPQNEKLVMIEVQTGSYLNEDDIVRMEDIYGRK